MLATWRIGPALAAGNTVVVKPPEWAPLTASLLADITHEAGLPAGVFNVVQGTGAEAGRPADRAPGHQPALVHRLGADRRRRSPPRPRPTSCRCPSSSAASRRCWSSTTADLDLAVDLAVEQFDNAGQVCLGAFRLLVHERIADEFLERVVERAAAAGPGRPARRGDRRQRAGQPARTSSGSRLRRAGDRRRRQAGARRRPQRGARRALLLARRSWSAPSRAARSSPRRCSARC